MIHLTLQQLSAFLDEELVESSAEIVRRHLAKCEECTVKFATLEEQDETLAAALVIDPDEDVLERIAMAVEASIQAGSPHRATAATLPPERRPRTAPPPAPSAEPEPRPAAEPAPERRSRAAWVAAAVIFVISASVCVVGVRSGKFLPRPPEAADQRTVEAPPSAPPAREPARVEDTPAPEPDRGRRPVPEREPRPAPAIVPEREPASAPAAAPARTPKPAPSPTSLPPAAPKRVAVAPPRAVQSSRTDDETGHLLGGPAKNLIPVIHTTTTVETLRVESPLAPPPEPSATAPSAAGAGKESARRAAKDEFASLPPNILTQVRAAERRLDEAASDPAADGYDAAAVEWEHALSLLRATSHEVAVRLQLAQARYRAWQLSPNAYRSAAATAALRSYMMMAAPGPDRDEAKERLAELRR